MTIRKTVTNKIVYYLAYPEGKRFEQLEAARTYGGRIRKFTEIHYTVTVEYQGKTFQAKGLKVFSGEAVL